LQQRVSLKLAQHVAILSTFHEDITLVYFNKHIYIQN